MKWARTVLDAQFTGAGDKSDAGVIRMHFSGCSASCAQPQIADIGFRGDIAHVDEHIEEAVDIGLGGSLGPDAAFIDWVHRCPSGGQGARRRSCAWCPATRRSGERANPSTLGPVARQPEFAATISGVAAERSRHEALPGARTDERDHRATGKVWFWELEAGVIDADRCIECGTCVAVCPPIPSGSTSTPTCPSWSRCAPAVPCAGTSVPEAACVTRPCGRLRRPLKRRRRGVSRAGSLRFGRHLLEDHRWTTGRRPRCRGRQFRRAGGGRMEDVQDGGAVSALLIGLLAAGESTGPWCPNPAATPTSSGKASPRSPPRRTEIKAASGSFYNQTMALAELDLSSYKLPPKPRIAWSVRRARCRALRACRPVAGRPARIGSTPWCSPSR